jgi:diketogulonate reductase-like aldo/keto reductase
MRARTFGTTGRKVPVMGQGTWAMERDRADAVRALRRGLDLGLTHLDTAEMYGDGAVEELVGEAIAGRRDDVFLASKVLPANAGYTATLAACEASLRRLRTDRLDLYLLHWREPDTPLAETLRAFDRLLTDGKIRAFGVSNFDVPDLEEAWALDRRIACNQVLYHLEERSIEHAVLPWCRRRKVALVGYSPFGSGQFPGPRSAGGRALAEVAAAHGATPRQVALAFLTREPGTFAIPKAARVEHAEENAGAHRLRLGDDDLAKLGRAFPLVPADTLPTL